MGILLSKLLNWVNIKFILCDWLTLPAVWENNTILQCVPGTVMYSGTSMGYFALQHNPSKPMGDTRNYTAVQCTWYPPIHIKKYIKNTQHLPAAHMRSWLTPAHCSRASARISMPSLFLSSPPPLCVSVLPWAAGTLAFLIEHSDRMLWHPPLFLLFDRSGIVSWAWRAGIEIVPRSHLGHTPDPNRFFWGNKVCFVVTGRPVTAKTESGVSSGFMMNKWNKSLSK